MAKSVLRIGLLAALVALTAPSVRRADAQSASGSAIATPALEGGPAMVTLITGDRVALSFMTDGRPVVAVQPASGLQGYQTLIFGAHVYVIPFAAAGYLGAPLDLSLFDVTALAAAGYADPAVPLAVDITASASAPALPGITLVAPGKGRQRRADAAQFGKALVAETRTRKQRQAEKQSVAAERRAIKKSARRYLKRQLLSELEDD